MKRQKLKKEEAHAVLEFYQKSGVHTLVSNEAGKAFKQRAKPDAKSTSQTASGYKVAQQLKPQVIKADFLPTADAVKEARALADKAKSREELEAAIRGFEGCSIKKLATNTVFSDGNPNAQVMLIGEAPGASEDEQGIPFCGASGKLLDKMLASVGLDRNNVYISNTIFWRPPGNRVPSKEELAMCLPFVEKHIYLINPKLLIFCGGTSATHMMKSEIGITKLRGKIYTYKNQYLEAETPAAVLYHPSFLLRQPGQKRQVWHDLQMIREYIDNNRVSI